MVTELTLPTAVNTNDYKKILVGELHCHGIDESQLKIVDSIRTYCAEIGHPEWEDSDLRLAKCLHLTSPPTILLKSSISHDEHSTGMLPMVGREFPMEKIESLNDPEQFLRHLLLHEIAHIKRREIHLNMDQTAIETDCDEWAFQKI